ncbi:hypothetical protein EI545_13880 [Tabrizicola piscis]|uniref:Uncharacterized protein n=1 Tax=Tabrizicola piscis TaxID=2494374 RepID=A0A3S8UC70_9RHOB|nr:hypothetical protein [Tabrizicola piscis]AZL61186.1 hypothetical protein EI545_13880 [Tabrizicola piscis]
MPRKFRLTRRFAAAMTEDGYRALRRFSADTGLEEGEALSFLFENLTAVVDAEELAARLRQFRTDLEARKA